MNEASFIYRQVVKQVDGKLQEALSLLWQLIVRQVDHSLLVQQTRIQELEVDLQQQIDAGVKACCLSFNH